MTETPADAGHQGNQAPQQAPEPNVEAPRAAKSSGKNKSRVRIGAVVALAIVAGVVAWVIVDRHSNSNASSTTTQPVTGPVVKSIGPVAMSKGSLHSEAARIGQPVYWAGAQRGHTYEFTRTTANNLYVRYLPAGVKGGAPGSGYLIVATYPDTNAYRGLMAVAHGQQVKLPGGGIALVDASYPKSVHLAFPGVPYQVEVYDPSPATALQVATSGKVAPVG
jgi:hypothetical protein